MPLGTKDDRIILEIINTSEYLYKQNLKTNKPMIKLFSNLRKKRIIKVPLGRYNVRFKKFKIDPRAFRYEV